MKINEKNLSAFATSGNQVDREGYLMKKGDGNKGFCKRWFVLKGNLLFYFEKKSDREPLGVIILEGSTVELAESESQEYFCFKVIFPSKSYVLSAESQTAMEVWMKSLACASYDYVKLMAVELQRQLDELCKGESEEGKQSASFNEVTGANSTTSNNEMPTPPPRTRVAHSQTQRSSPRRQRRTFASLHEEFGAKILKDQKTRWSEQGKTTTVPTHSGLSVVKQDLMNF